NLHGAAGSIGTRKINASPVPSIIQVIRSGSRVVDHIVVKFNRALGWVNSISSDAVANRIVDHIVVDVVIVHCNGTAIIDLNTSTSIDVCYCIPTDFHRIGVSEVPTVVQGGDSTWSSV